MAILPRVPVEPGRSHGRTARLITARTLGATIGLAALLAGGRGADAVEAPPPPSNLPAVSATASATPRAAVNPPAVNPPAVNPPATARPEATSTSLASNRQIVLELGKRTISLLEGSKVIGSWPVAVGDPATPTPTGTFAVRNKVVNPQYQSTRSGKNNPTTGPNGPLGDRWIGFHTAGRDQFGIHGTPPAWEWTVTSRAAVSHGCVRMLTPHVRLLFDQVDIGTPVIVKR